VEYLPACTTHRVCVCRVWEWATHAHTHSLFFSFLPPRDQYHGEIVTASGVAEGTCTPAQQAVGEGKGVCSKVCEDGHSSVQSAWAWKGREGMDGTGTEETAVWLQVKGRGKECNGAVHGDA
jgi:hypothetical protein